MTVETSEELTAHIVAATAQATARATAQALAEGAIAAAVIVAKETSSSMAAIAVLQAKVEILNTQQNNFEIEINRKIDSLSITFKEVFSKLDDVIQGRPTWAVTIITGGLFAVCTGLIVYTATHIK